MHATQSGLQQLVGETRSAIGKIKNGCLMESVKATPKRVLTCVKLVHNALQGSAAYHSGMADAQKAERVRQAGGSVSDVFDEESDMLSTHRSRVAYGLTNSPWLVECGG